MPISRQLNPVRQSSRDILQEVSRAPGIAEADQPRQDQFALRFNSALAKRREYLPATVYLDGVDISNECFELDDKEGYASVFVRDATGNHYLVDNEVAKATRYGTVVFVPRHDPT